MFVVVSGCPTFQAVPSWGSWWDVWLTYGLDSTVYCWNWKSSSSSIPLYLWGLIPASAWTCTWRSPSEWLPRGIMLFLTLSIRASQVSLPPHSLAPGELGGNRQNFSGFKLKKKNTYRHIAKVTPDKLVARLAYANSDSRIGQPPSEAAQKVAHFFHEDGGKEPGSGAEIFIFKLPSHLQDSGILGSYSGILRLKVFLL